MPLSSANPTQAAIRRELHFFSLYRVLEAALLCLIVFSPMGFFLGGLPRHPLLAMVVASSYFLIACGLFFLRHRGEVRAMALLGVGADIGASMLAMHALPSAASGIAMMLLFNVGAAALLLPLRLSLCLAAIAGVALVGDYTWAILAGHGSGRPLAEVLMFAVSYLAIATLTSVVGRQMRDSQALAEERGSQVANMAEVSELIIRRMRTGVLLVEGNGEIRLANEAAMLQLGNSGEGRRTLATAAPELARRLHRWQHDGDGEPTPLQLTPDLPEILPRFTRLLAGGDQVLVFLDDA